MARIVVEGTKFGNNYGIGSNIAYTLVSSPATGRIQLKDATGCRDYTNDLMIAYINYDPALGNKNSHHWSPDRPPVDFRNLRLLISTSSAEEKMVRRIHSAKRVINMYEDLAGWQKKSCITRVTNTCTHLPNCWLMTGPGKWMRSSHLVSLVTLTTRVIYNNGGFEKLENLDQVEDRFRELCNGSANNYGGGDLGTYFKSSWPLFRMIMTKYDELFGKYKPTDLMPEKLICKWHSCGGIYSLCTFHTGVEDLDKRMESAYNAWKKENK